jgi:hypothetical protein
LSQEWVYLKKPPLIIALLENVLFTVPRWLMQALMLSPFLSLNISVVCPLLNNHCVRKNLQIYMSSKHRQGSVSHGSVLKFLTRIMNWDFSLITYRDTSAFD